MTIGSRNKMMPMSTMNGVSAKLAGLLDLDQVVRLGLDRRHGSAQESPVASARVRHRLSAQAHGQIVIDELRRARVRVVRDNG